MWLTRLSIQRPVFVICLLASLVLMGLYSRSKMPVEQRPNVDIPRVSITTVYPGTGPSEIESLITKPIEDSVSAVNSIQNIRSASQFGLSIVALDFDIGANSHLAAQEVRQKVDAAQELLPEDADPPVVERFDINAAPVLYLGLKGDRPVKELRFLADHDLKYQLSQVPGVGRVEVTGGDVREIQVRVDKARLNAYSLSITELVSALLRANSNVPSGHITESQHDYDARLVGEFQSVEELRNVRVPARIGSPPRVASIRLGDVASVEDAVRDRSDITRVYSRDASGALIGGDGIGLVITKLSDANTIRVVDAVYEELHAIEQQSGGSLQFVTALDTSRTIRDQLADINVSLILGALLAVLVVFLFLHTFRATVICAIAIPTSLIAAFIPMFFLNQSLNSMTMLGLSLVVGILVDDTIVVLENIFRHLHRGEQPREAAFNGRTEIGLAAVTITLVDVVVFLPMLWMGGIIGQFFRAFGLTVAVCTLFSLLVSFTVTPWLASRWFRIGEDLETKRGFFLVLERAYQVVERSYCWLLAWALQRRILVVMTGVLTLVIVGSWGTKRLKQGFFPLQDQSRLALTVELPEGSSLEATDAVVTEMQNRLTTVADIQTMYINIGTIQGGFRNFPEQGRQYAQVQMQLYDKPDVLETILGWFGGGHRGGEPRRKLDDTDVAANIRGLIADVPGGRTNVVPIRGFGGGSAPIQIDLLGFDLEEMLGMAEAMRDRIKTVPGAVDPDVSLRPGKPEAQIFVDRVRASELGVDVAQVGAALRAAVEGDINAKYREAGEQYDIRVRLRQADRDQVDQLAGVIIANRTVDGVTRPVYLRDVARVEMNEGPSKIERVNRLRKVTVSAFVLPNVAAINLMGDIRTAIADVPLGAVRMRVGGELERAQREYPYLLGSLMLSIIFVYLLMAVLFDNLLHPFTIQLVLPMAFVGAILALVIMDQQLSVVSMTGFIMLAGIVQKNAILIIDYTNTLRARGYDVLEAIRTAGQARLRPILMTTLSTVFGMLPVALTIGRASGSRAPLATCVIGGLLLSTVLSLIIIPCVYSLFDDALIWLQDAMRLRGQRGQLVDRALGEEPTGAE